MACTMQGSGIAGVDWASAFLKMNEDGSFFLQVGASDVGAGADTVLSQIAAETLGVSLDKIIITSGDTDITPFDVGAYASSTTIISGGAVKKAAEQGARAGAGTGGEDAGRAGGSTGLRATTKCSPRAPAASR